MEFLQFTIQRWTTALGYRSFSSKTHSPVTHVIFDLDGTLLDTEIIYKRLFKKIMENYGVEYDDETHRNATGMDLICRSRFIAERSGHKVTAEELHDRMNEIRKDFLPDCKLKPGAERLVTHLHCSKVPIAIATGSSEESFRMKAKNHSKFFCLFHHFVSGTSDPEVVKNKPEPDVYLVAARRFEKKPDPKKVGMMRFVLGIEPCLAFEDSLFGMQSAKTAGMQVVMIPENDYTPKQIKEATLVIKSFDDFEPGQFSLPPYPRG